MPDQNQSPIAAGSQMPMTPEEQPRGGVGPIAGAIIVILLLIAGGLYFWGAKINEKSQENTMPYIPSNDTMQMQMQESASPTDSAGLPPQSTSDDASSIESDFNAMNLESIDSQNEAELNSI